MSQTTGGATQELLEFLVKHLVDNPEEVVISCSETDNSVNYEIKVAQGDQGKVIGRQGKIANALLEIFKVVML